MREQGESESEEGRDVWEQMSAGVRLDSFRVFGRDESKQATECDQDFLQLAEVPGDY